MTLVSKEAASPSKPVEECEKEIKAVFQLKYLQQTRVTELYSVGKVSDPLSTATTVWNNASSHPGFIYAHDSMYNKFFK